MPDAALVSEAPRPVTSKSPWYSPPEWSWPLSICLQAVIVWLLTAYAYFYQDDFIFLQQARTLNFGWAYLSMSLFEHFSPVTRLLNSLLVIVGPGNFTLTHAVQLLLYLIAVAAFALLMVTILGNRWSAFALTCLFGQSVFLLRLLGWWTATANILPATALGLIAVVGYLRWHGGASRPWLAASFGAFAISLFDYETALLLPAFLLLTRLLILEERPSPTAWLRALWQERWVWLGFFAIDIVALLNYLRTYYFPVAHPSHSELVEFLGIALFGSFAPALAGIETIGSRLLPHLVAIVAADLLAFAVMLAVLWFRPKSWRCLIVFAVIFTITMVPLGLDRIRLFGLSIAQELYYQQSLQYMTLALFAFAISPRWGGRRAARGRVARHRVLFPHLSRRVIAAGAMVAVAAYSALYLSSAGALEGVDQGQRTSHAYVDAFMAGVEQIESMTGHQPNLLDLEDVPPGIMATAFVPFNRYDEFFPLIDPTLRYDQTAGQLFVVSASGQLVPVAFHASAWGVLGHAGVDSSAGAAGAPASTRGSAAACVPDGAGLSDLYVPLSSDQTLGARGNALPFGIRVAYDLPVHQTVTVMLTTAEGTVPETSVVHVWGPGTSSEIFPLQTPDGSETVTGVGFDLQAGSCITSLALGEFDVSGPPLP